MGIKFTQSAIDAMEEQGIENPHKKKTPKEEFEKDLKFFEGLKTDDEKARLENSYRKKAEFEGKSWE